MGKYLPRRLGVAVWVTCTPVSNPQLYSLGNPNKLLVHQIGLRQNCILLFCWCPPGVNTHLFTSPQGKLTHSRTSESFHILPTNQFHRLQTTCVIRFTKVTVPLFSTSFSVLVTFLVAMTKFLVNSNIREECFILAGGLRRDGAHNGRKSRSEMHGHIVCTARKQKEMNATLACFLFLIQSRTQLVEWNHSHSR